MSGGNASIFSPSTEPIFDGMVVRNPTRVQQQGGTGYGGAGEFPFAWSMPGLINYNAVGVAQASVAAKSIETIYYSMITAATITVQFFVNGVFAFEAAGISGTGTLSTGGQIIPPGAWVGCYISDVGTGAGEGLWIGLTELA